MAENRFVVIDIGGTKIRTALWNGSSLDQIESIVTPKVSAPEFLNILNRHVSDKISGERIAGIGISSAGPIDVSRGVILNPANLGNGDESWLQLDLKKTLLPEKKLPCTVDNDAAMTAWGQYKHIEKEKCQDLVVLTLGTGVGVSAVINGQLARAGQNMHPEVGHLLISDQVDPIHETPFANFPTLESYLSGHHFAIRVGEKLGRPMTGREVIDLGKTQDKVILEMWDEYSRRIAICLTNLILCYFPKKIVLAGGFVNGASEYFLPSALVWLEKLLTTRLASGMSMPEVEVSDHYNELPLFGAGYQVQALATQ